MSIFHCRKFWSPDTQAASVLRWGYRVTGVVTPAKAGPLFVNIELQRRRKLHKNHKTSCYYDSETKIKDVIYNCGIRPNAACMACPRTPPSAWNSTYFSQASCLRQCRCAWTLRVINGVRSDRQRHSYSELQPGGRPTFAPRCCKTAP